MANLLQLRSFATADRFIAEVSSPQIRPGYVLVGDEIFLQDRCRHATLSALAPADQRDFCLHDLDLAETSLFDALDRAQTPSLMAPFQLFVLRNLKTLYTRGSKKDEFAAIQKYFRSPNPHALLLFIADHLHLPSDLRRMDYQDKERFDRIRDTLGDQCALIELARVSEEDAARELVDSLGANMMLVASELEKLLLYTTAPTRITGVPTPARITPGDVETMVLAAQQRSLYELTDAITAHDRPRAVALLHGLLNASDAGEEAAIGHLFMLAKTFRQMLIILERNVRDSRAIWQALWQGFRMPPFAAEELIRQARRYRSHRELTRALRLIARADLELRSSPISKRLVLERLVLELTANPASRPPFDPAPQFAMEF